LEEGETSKDKGRGYMRRFELDHNLNSLDKNSIDRKLEKKKFKKLEKA